MVQNEALLMTSLVYPIVLFRLLREYDKTAKESTGNKIFALKSTSSILTEKSYPATLFKKANH